MLSPFRGGGRGSEGILIVLRNAKSLQTNALWNKSALYGGPSVKTTDLLLKQVPISGMSANPDLCSERDSLFRRCFIFISHLPAVDTNITALGPSVFPFPCRALYYTDFNVSTH